MKVTAEIADNLLGKVPRKPPRICGQKSPNYSDLMMYSLRIHHAKQVVLVCNNNERLLTGEAMKRLAILEGGLERGVSIVVNNAGKIECVDFDDKVDQDYHNCTFEEEVDASGMCVVPGKTNSFHKINDK